jgi:hypothetical protein
MQSQTARLGSGRYVLLQRLRGEGSKKLVDLAHDARLDRDMALAIILVSSAIRELVEGAGSFRFDEPCDVARKGLAGSAVGWAEERP